MNKVKELEKFIKKGERAKAEALLDKIYEENECRAYSTALEKILLTEVASALNDSVRGFYIDVESLKEALFSENPPTRKTVLDSLRDILSDAAEADCERVFKKAKDYIKHKLSDSQLSAESVSEYVGVKAKTLVNVFRENEEKSVSEYITAERIKLSLSYLENGETISKTCEKCGFSSAETYIRAFKKHIGTTPGEWKRNKLFL